MKTEFMITITTDDRATVENVAEFVKNTLDRATKKLYNSYGMEWAELSDFVTVDDVTSTTLGRISFTPLREVTEEGWEELESTS